MRHPHLRYSSCMRSLRASTRCSALTLLSWEWQTESGCTRSSTALMPSFGMLRTLSDCRTLPGLCSYVLQGISHPTRTAVDICNCNCFCCSYGTSPPPTTTTSNSNVLQLQPQPKQQRPQQQQHVTADATGTRNTSSTLFTSDRRRGRNVSGCLSRPRHSRTQALKLV